MFCRLLSLLPCLLLIGCSSSSKDGGSTADPPVDRYRIAVIPKGLTHQHWQSVERGALAAARDLEKTAGKPIEVLWDGPRKESDAVEQINLVDQKVRMGL